MPKSDLTGSRIREHRLMRGLKQADLARESGISASYLNLIEHNRRRIGGKTLLALSGVLQIDPSQLSQGAEHAVVSALQSAAASKGQGDAAGQVELNQIDDLVARFPGWAAKITDQHRRLQALEQTIGGLNDQLTHDPVLSEKMHEVLSTVSAIRSTASILVGNPELDVKWQSRFYSNIDTESRRLADSSAAMAAHLDRLSHQDGAAATPLEALFAAQDRCGHHVAKLEEGADVEAALEGLALASGAEASAVSRDYMEQYQRDVAAMPLEAFQSAAAECGFDPAALAARFNVPLPAALRRLGALPRGPMQPEIGLVICDAAGAFVQRKSPSGLALPQYGAGCALWPVFAAMAAPGQPLRRSVQSDNGARFTAYAVAHPAGAPSFDAPPLYRATMVLVEAAEAEAPAAQEAPLRIGSGCRLCAHDGCHARREPSVLAAS